MVQGKLGEDHADQGRGVPLTETGRRAPAESGVSSAFSKPLDALVGQALSARQQGNYAAAREYYLAAVRQKPADVALAIDAAACCLAVHDVMGAAKLLKGYRSQGLPDVVASRLLCAQGLALKRLGRPDDAVACFSASLQRASLLPALDREVRREWSDTLLNTLGDPRASAAVYGVKLVQSSSVPPLSARPDAPAFEEDAWLAQLIAGLYTGDVDAASLVEGFRSFASHHLALSSIPPRPTEPAAAHKRRRPRIGLISNQFCSSPVGFLTLRTVEELSKLAELVIFDRGAKQDWANARFRQASQEWVDCSGLDPGSLAARLRSAELDALFDLAGWMDLDVLRAFAIRPVTRQFKWVGGQSLTTGLGVFDGFVADRRQVPPGSEHLYSEPVLRLKHSYITYASPPYRDFSAQALHPPAVRKARPGHYALVSNPAKVGAGTLAMVRSLKPKRLVLLDHRWRHAHTKRLAEQWFGGHVEKVDFITPAHHPAYLDALQELDAAVLDTQPYSMGLTAVELRLLGVPVVLAPRASVGTMREFHAQAHAGAEHFAGAAAQAGELLRWCVRA